eukprot:CAMPEP_0115155040 /NCGR_PEP_ID=MMETSP0227-20121206/67662_1 /TAXON_ID=89957 /ORGANISM="Polarella glacialis, Strain CCMP 1383" /LENGTH=34 /DNA_ID= /DNA_START= /DNA_END= /DNA_ORIENTATION=
MKVHPLHDVVRVPIKPEGAHPVADVIAAVTCPHA